MMIIKSVKLENWAKSQKRVTVGRIRKEFGVDEELAQNYYDYLKSAGIVGRMGMVKRLMSSCNRKLQRSADL